MMRVLFHPDAEAELLGAVEFYEARSSGLGSRFLAEVERGAALLAESPVSWAVLSGDIRRYLLRPFPYALLYWSADQCGVIVAVMHLHREPGYWRTRLQSR